MPRPGDAMVVLLRPSDVGAVLLRPTNAEIVAWAANATLAGRFPARRAQGTAPFARQLASRISFPQVTRGCLGTVRRAVATMPRRCPTTAVSGARLSNYRENLHRSDVFAANWTALQPCARCARATGDVRENDSGARPAFAPLVRTRRSHRWRASGVRTAGASGVRAIRPSELVGNAREWDGSRRQNRASIPGAAGDNQLQGENATMRNLMWHCLVMCRYLIVPGSPKRIRRLHLLGLLFTRFAGKPRRMVLRQLVRCF